MLIGFDYYVELESAKHVPVFVKPSKIRGLQKKIDRGSKVPAIEWQEKSCFEW